MLVDVMEYQGPSGLGSLQGSAPDDAFLELLSNTGLTNPNTNNNNTTNGNNNNNHNKKKGPAYDFGNDDVLPSYDFQPSSSFMAHKSMTGSNKLEDGQSVQASSYIHTPTSMVRFWIHRYLLCWEFAFQRIHGDG
jgi:hypothetical protein